MGRYDGHFVLRRTAAENYGDIFFPHALNEFLSWLEMLRLGFGSVDTLALS